MINFQEMIAKLTEFWALQGCLVEQGYDLEVGAGTFNPATFLRCLGPEPYSTIYVEPSRRPSDGRYGENPNRVQSFHQMQVILKPAPEAIQDLYLRSLEAIGLNLKEHDIRFVHDDWENPTIGAWGLGWEVWSDGMEITQFTYFQAVGGIPVKPVSGELTYGLERLAMYVQGVDSVFDLMWNDEIRYGDLFHRSEFEWSRYNFEESDAAMWLRHFEDYEGESKRLVRAKLPIPAYDFVMKASHAFNMLDARGVISVTERTGYIGRIRAMAKALAECYLEGREAQKFPLLKKSPREKPPSVSPLSTRADPGERETFLLEIGSEELPATFVPIGLQNLKSLVAHFLKENALSYDHIEVMGTPRRLAVLIHGLVGGSAPQSVERKGPALSTAFEVDGTPTKAGGGFFRSLGLNVTSLRDVEQGAYKELSIESTKQGSYLFATLKTPARSTRKMLAESLARLILKIEFPKKMRWEENDIEYARPIRWLVALYGNEVIPFAIGQITSGKTSLGHRQLDPSPFAIEAAADYKETLRSHQVMVSVSERRESIESQVEKLEKKLKGKVVAKERVMAEVLHLVEWPFVTAAHFDEKFLEAPREVLVSEMVEHQRYFPLESQKALLPHFLIVCNTKPNDLIRKGNQKALSARLADGVFLYEEDLKVPLEHFNTQLKKMTYQKELGSVWDKVVRLKKISEMLHATTPLGDLKDVIRAAELCKADLASQLVGEFPELQGHVGMIYALESGEPQSVALAIEQHWMPRGERAPLPTSPTGILLSLSEKIDNLLSCFVLGLKPTSSSDPYALRRQAIGLIKTVIEAKIHLPIERTFSQALALFLELTHKKPDENVVGEIEEFLMGRMRTILQSEGFRKEAIEAVLGQGLSSPFAIYRKLLALQELQENEPELIQALEQMYTRVHKLLLSQNKNLIPGWFANRQRAPYNMGRRFPEVDLKLFEEKIEKKLFEQIEVSKKRLHLELLDRRDPENHDYLKAFAELRHFEAPLNQFFEEVKVIAEDPDIRANRLALLQEVWDLFEEVLDFNKLS